MTDQDSVNLIYGIHTCNAQLKLNPGNIKKIYLKKAPVNNQISKIAKQAENFNILIEEAEKDFLTTLCLSSKHQGVVCELNNKLLSSFDIDLYLQTEKKPFIVIFDSIQDPRNLGSCIRSSNAAGVSLIIKRKSNSCEISPLVHKTASGGLQGLSLLETNNLAMIIKKLKTNNIRVIGTADSSESTIYEMEPCDTGVAVILGSEGVGISKSLLELCDDICKIPIYGSVECLNVAVATGITLYQIRKMIKKTK